MLFRGIVAFMGCSLQPGRMSTRIELTTEVKYELLLDISQKVRATLDLDEILNILLDKIGTLIRYNAAGIFVLNEDMARTPYYRPTGIIAGIAQRGFDPHTTEADPMLAAGQGIIGYVIRTGESVVIRDVLTDARYVEGRQRTRSEIAVPIVRNGRTMGALNLESDTVGAFDQNDIEILRFVADAAATSIEKSLLHLQILEKERIEDQMRIAREVQLRLLPDNPPRIPGYSIAGFCIPAFEIGGDYFDYVLLDDGTLGIVIADVSGDGIPGALLMTSFRALFLPHAKAQTHPAHLMRRVNALLPEFARKRDFVTSVYAILDPRRHTLLYSNAGHNPPLVLHTTGEIALLDRGGPSLNLFADQAFEAGEVTLGQGDIIVAYTDGVTEAFSPDREEFGLTRLKQILAGLSRGTADEIARSIIRSIQDFSGTETFSDDFTIVVVKREV